MIFGEYATGHEELPRVLNLSIARAGRALPRKGEPLEFLVGIHEEGTGLAWQQDVTLDPDREAELLKATAELTGWSVRLSLTETTAKAHVETIGAALHEVFVGPAGQSVLETIPPTAILLSVDETILDLPWELLRGPEGVLAHRHPFGRIVASRIVPKPGRDPTQQDQVVKILAVVDPTSELRAARAELAALEGVEGDRTPYHVEVEVLEREEATRERFLRSVEGGDFDIFHFAGHARFDPDAPERSALRLADGLLSADEVLDLPWAAPPGFVFDSACQSGVGGGRRRLVSDTGHGNGLAAAFLAAGAAAYGGYFWPVSDEGANRFATTFYRSLFTRENVGLAFQDARNAALATYDDGADLTAFGAVLFGDAASQHRRDLASAA